jgi:hypothetical protein
MIHVAGDPASPRPRPELSQPGITTAVAEGLNAKIQWIKYASRGFRDREGFKSAICFHCGGLDLDPR